jgi:uncharacterized protein YecA (UPF0149 family)
MAAILTTPAHAFIETSNTVRKQLMGDNVVSTEVFTGRRARDIQDAMDARQREVEAVGGQMVHRTRIGRNSPCLCGSGLKFKKCCIDKAAVAG